jgi:hypothetical protein
VLSALACTACKVLGGALLTCTSCES